MAHEEGHGLMSEDERYFRKALYDMYGMVKALYNERTSRLQGEISNQQKCDGADGKKPPPPPPHLPPFSPHPHLLQHLEILLLDLQKEMLSLLFLSLMSKLNFLCTMGK